jgi:hypothetical protein
MQRLEEKEYLKLCKQKIEAIINIGNSANWTQQDYEYLSELIYEKTNVQLSISTLKRLWVYRTETIPNISTLDSLSRFLNYRDWYDFKNKNIIGSKSNISQVPRKTTRSFKLNQKVSVYTALALIIIVTGIILIANRFSPINPNDVVFELKKNVPSGLPNTVVFHYDISKTGFNKAFIQQDWDASKRAKVLAANNYYSTIYYYPDHYDAKIVVDNKIIKTIPLLIITDGWLALVRTERYQERPVYIDKKNLEKENLHISPEHIKTLGIDITKDYFVSFYKIQDFGNITGDNFTLVSEIRNNVNEGGAFCQYSEIVIKFENGRLLTPFSNIGCTSILDINYGDKYLKGSENDFSALGTNFSDWKTIKIQVINKHVSVYIERKKVFDLAFNASLGKLIGIHYLFNGCGSVRKTELFDQNSNLVYSDYFGNKHKVAN